MAPRPQYLTMRDRTTGEPVDIPTESIPRELWPENWYNNPSWQIEPTLKGLRPLMEDYLYNRELSEPRVKILATYFVDYACHIAMASYLLGGGEGTLVFNLEVIRRLRTLAKSASSLEDLRLMIDVGMEAAIDPI